MTVVYISHCHRQYMTNTSNDIARRAARATTSTYDSYTRTAAWRCRVADRTGAPTRSRYYQYRLVATALSSPPAPDDDGFPRPRTLSVTLHIDYDMYSDYSAIEPVPSHRRPATCLYVRTTAFTRRVSAARPCCAARKRRSSISLSNI